MADKQNEQAVLLSRVGKCLHRAQQWQREATGADTDRQFRDNLGEAFGATHEALSILKTLVDAYDQKANKGEPGYE